MKETRSVPCGPIQEVEEFYAPARLGFSMYINRLWAVGFVEWHILVGRVLEKSTDYAMACLDEVLSNDESHWTGCT